MTHTDQAPTGTDWITQLEDSVRGLGEAAREWQVAHQAAQVLARGVETDRRALSYGQISVHRPGSAGWDAKRRQWQPHPHALWDLQRLYVDSSWRIREQYEHAALLYASGAAWAIARVQAGRPRPGGYTITGLDRYAGARTLAAAHDRLDLLDLDTAEDVSHIGAADEVMALPDAAYQ